MKQILDGIKVLDLTRVLAGPWCTQFLSDLGAEVIKIESTDGGDESRKIPPFFPGSGSTQDGRKSDDADMSAFFASCNRGKKSVTVDLMTADGQALVKDLVKSCDVLVENFKVGNLKKFGLDYQSLSAINPALVYCSITGFGQTGPMAAYPGYDILFQGISGAMSTCGLPDGEPGAGPMRTLLPYTDLLTGMYACSGILAAILHKNKTGEGQYIDLALLDVAMAATAYIGTAYLASGKSQTRVGNSGVAAAPSGKYPCVDGSVIIQCNHRHWLLLCDLFQREDWKLDPRFSTITTRFQHAAQLDVLVSEVTGKYKQQDLVALIGSAGIPCAPVNTIAQAFAEPQVVYRELVQTVALPDGGSVQVVRNPLRFSKTPTSISAPPRLGADNLEVMASAQKI